MAITAVAKLDKDKDAFDAWSKQRAELLAQANARLMNRSFNGYLSSFSGWDSWFWGPRRVGLWTYSPRAGCYTFLPFYFGWSSPYGHGYGSYYWRGPAGAAMVLETPSFERPTVPYLAPQGVIPQEAFRPEARRREL